MAEALAAIGIAATVLQFVDCGIRWMSNANEIYTDGTGTLKENNELEAVIQSIRGMMLGLK